MKLNEYFIYKNTSIDDIRNAAEMLVGSSDQDVLVAVGSVAEGLGNSKSNLDLLLISPRGDEAGESDETEYSWLSGDCIVDMQILATSDVVSLIDRLNSWAMEPWDVSRPCGFSDDELLLLHRLRNGVPLNSDQEKQKAQGLLPELSNVARLKLHVARHTARTIQVDMVGYKGLVDDYSLIYASQDLLGHVADGLLAAFQKTNPNPKWRSRLLHELPPDWALQIASSPLPADARQAVWDMHYAPLTIDADTALAHACKSTTFGRAVFAWAEYVLVHDLDGALQQPSWPDQSPGEPRQSLAYLELDVDFVISADGVSVARLNEFEDTLQFSLNQFPLILLHDGITTAAEALSAMTDGDRSSNDNSHIENVIDQVSQSGLVLTHPAGGVPS